MPGLNFCLTVPLIAGYYRYFIYCSPIKFAYVQPTSHSTLRDDRLHLHPRTRISMI